MASASSPESLCEACANLNLTRSDFEQPPFEPEGRYHSILIEDSIGNLRKRREECPLCQLFYHALMKNEAADLSLLECAPSETKWQVSWKQSTFEYEPSQLGIEDLYGSALYPCLEADGSHTDHAVQLIDESDTNGFLRARRISDKLDISVAKHWLDLCASEHGPDCGQDVMKLHFCEHPRTMQTPFLVIDVFKQCLVPLPDGETYAALSYVWGATNTLRTVNANLEEFKKPGALSQQKVPRTIADTMEVTRQLGETYLWVDSLCIVQDNPMKQHLINNMDAVYTHASFTIVAASGGHADAGLSGWSDSSRRREAICTRNIGNNFCLGVTPNLDITLMNCDHAKRGWTFQEGMLSTRCIVFLDSLLYFCCQTTNWREDVHAEVGTCVVPWQGANVLCQLTHLEPLSYLRAALFAYTERKLTYQSDALNAFVGAQKALSRSLYNTRFWYGMPASFFDWALLFGAPAEEVWKRRKGFKSWSWAGWEGSIVLPNVHSEMIDYCWLLTRTWIDWYIVDFNFGLVLVWDPERDATVRTALSDAERKEEVARTKAHMSSLTSHIEKDVGLQDAIDEALSASDELEGSSSSAENGSESVEDEMNPCPQYGWPSPRNPYGRTALPHHQPPFWSPSKPGTSRSQIRQLLPGTLCFTTTYGGFRLSPVKSVSKRSHDSYFPLRDKFDNVCGTIWEAGHDFKSGAGAQPESTASCEVEIIALSHASPATRVPYERLGVNLGDFYVEASKHYRDTDYFDWLEHEEPHVWDMFNVMLIKPVSASGQTGAQHNKHIPLYESAGLGLLHRDAFVNALDDRAQWKEIYLT